MGRRPHSIPKGPDIVQNDRTFSACPGYRAPVAFQKTSSMPLRTCSQVRAAGMAVGSTSHFLQGPSPRPLPPGIIEFGLFHNVGVLHY